MHSKTLLLLIEALGLGALGLDRLYMGCPATGALKFLLFLLVVFFWYINDIIFLVFALSWMIWVIFDYVMVFVNALLNSPYNPFCNKFVYFSDDGGGSWFAVFLILSNVAILSVCGYTYFGPFSLFN